MSSLQSIPCHSFDIPGYGVNVFDKLILYFTLKN